MTVQELYELARRKAETLSFHGEAYRAYASIERLCSTGDTHTYPGWASPEKLRAELLALVANPRIHKARRDIFKRYADQLTIPPQRAEPILEREHPRIGLLASIDGWVGIVTSVTLFPDDHREVTLQDAFGGSEKREKVPYDHLRWF